MKALVVSRPGVLEMRDIPAPEPGSHDALVRLVVCGICSTTDSELIKGTQPYHRDYPAVLGHEGVGEVVAVGARVRHLKIGDLVTRPCAIWPGMKRDGLASAWGGFAEYGIARDRRALVEDGELSWENDYTAQRQNVLPMGMTPARAVLGIALAETASWLRLMPPVGGRRVCVSGTGIAGLAIALWCKLAGASQVIVLGRREERLKLAREIAADATVNVTREATRERVLGLTGGRGVHFYAEAVGHRDQVNTGLSVLAEGGEIGIYGAAPDQSYALEWGHGRGHAGVRLAPANEHLAFPWVADLFRRGWIREEAFGLRTWKFEDYEQAFSAIKAGQVIKGMLLIG